MVVIEAEINDGIISRGGHTWVVKSEPSYSGLIATPNNGACITANIGSTSPQVNYNVNFLTIGTYYAWIRGIGANGNDDSCHIGIDGSIPAECQAITISSKLSWNNKTMAGKVVSFTVTSIGKHVVNLFMREDGACIDRILLTPASTYKIAGAGPATSQRS